MRRDQNLVANPQAAAYPEKLSPESTTRETILIDPRGKVRLGTVRSESTVTYHGQSTKNAVSLLRVNRFRRAPKQIILHVPPLANCRKWL